MIEHDLLEMPCRELVELITVPSPPPGSGAVAREPFSLEHRADLLLASTWAVRSAARATDLMHRMGGTNGIYTRNRLERHFRDAPDGAAPWLLNALAIDLYPVWELETGPFQPHSCCYLVSSRSITSSNRVASTASRA